MKRFAICPKNPRIVKAVDAVDVERILTTELFIGVVVPNDDCPAIIEIFGNPLERIMLLQQYLNVDGEVIGEEGGSILDPSNIKDLENLLMEQMTAAQKESVYKREKQLVDEFEKKNKSKNKKY